MKIRLVKDFTEEFKKDWEYAFDAEIMKPGWITEIDDSEMKKEGTFFSSDGYGECVRICPEENKHHINFPRDHFEIIDDENIN